MELRYFIVDAFTDHPFGGNPAGVVLPVGDRFPGERRCCNSPPKVSSGWGCRGGFGGWETECASS
ncbi:MAG: PhzF family phenazine biosynthesis protein [Bacteroidales bacterium]|nr:PhzF family phenazine biosynthesis protein [Bacteroidales bacterium]